MRKLLFQGASGERVNHHLAFSLNSGATASGYRIVNPALSAGLALVSKNVAFLG